MIIDPVFSEVFSFSGGARSDETGTRITSVQARQFAQLLGNSPNFVQDNHSRSQQNVVRGMHYQLHRPQGKLLRVIAGSIFDVVVDVRRSSPTFGRWSGLPMTAETALERWVPAGFAHGFVVTSESAELIYKTTEYWAPEDERILLWNDPALGIDWPLSAPPILSAKDAHGVPLDHAEVFA